jgi:cyanophycinase-like exopeptidase
MRLAVLLVSLTLTLALQVSAQGPSSPKVGPPRGTVFAVGGGSGPDILAKFIEAAGGPDAFILTVPTARLNSDLSGAALSDASAPLKAAGAKNVAVLHTMDRQVADSDSFVEPIKRAGGVWFGGGAPELIINAYGGTKTATELRKVLERGGVVGGTSAGAVVLASHFIPSMRGALTEQTPQDAFGFLQGVGIEPHVRAANPRSWMLKRPDLLHIAADEVTAWVVRGDDAEIIGRGKAFVYRENPADPREPFISLHPGDRYNLSTHTVRRPIETSSLTAGFVDSLFADFAKPGSPAATVLVAQDGRILVDKSYNIPDQPQNVPTTSSPSFALGGLSHAINAIAVQILAADGKFALTDAPNGSRELAQLLAKNADMGLPEMTIQGMGWGTPYGAFLRVRVNVQRDMLPADLTTGEFLGTVDGLYLWEAALENPRLFPKGPAPMLYLDKPVPSRPAEVAPPDSTFGWLKDSYRGLMRLSLFGEAGGRRNAWVRIPEKRVSVIILTNKEDANAEGIAQRITDRLVSTAAAIPPVK